MSGLPHEMTPAVLAEPYPDQWEDFGGIVSEDAASFAIFRTKFYASARFVEAGETAFIASADRSQNVGAKIFAPTFCAYVRYTLLPVPRL